MYAYMYTLVYWWVYLPAGIYYPIGMYSPNGIHSSVGIQLFQERLSEKVARQSRKVLWGVLSSPFFKENLKEWHARR